MKRASARFPAKDAPHWAGTRCLSICTQQPCFIDCASRRQEGHASRPLAGSVGNSRRGDTPLALAEPRAELFFCRFCRPRPFVDFDEVEEEPLASLVEVRRTRPSGGRSPLDRNRDVEAQRRKGSALRTAGRQVPPARTDRRRAELQVGQAAGRPRWRSCGRNACRRRSASNASFGRAPCPGATSNPAASSAS